jgi:hypothetical protein
VREATHGYFTFIEAIISDNRSAALSVSSSVFFIKQGGIFLEWSEAGRFRGHLFCLQEQIKEEKGKKDLEDK